MQDSREQITEADRNGLPFDHKRAELGLSSDQKPRKGKKRLPKRPLDERMLSHLKRMSHGAMRSDFLNAMTAQLVVFSIELRYSKNDLIERIENLYTCIEQDNEKQRR